MINEEKYVIDRSNESNPAIIFDYDNCEKQLQKIDDLLNELDNMVARKYDDRDYEFPVEAHSTPSRDDNQAIISELDHILTLMPTGTISRAM